MNERAVVIFGILAIFYINLIVLANLKPNIIIKEKACPIVSTKVYSDFIYIPAVNGDTGVLTRFYINIFRGDGKVFVSLPPFFDQKSAISFVLAKEAICKLYPNCNNFTYLFYTNDVIYGEGFSGTAGFSLLILTFFKNKTRIVNYPITGFMLPNGIIAPVAGIEKKLNATLKRFRYLVAPARKKNILEAYTILDLLKIYFNESFNLSFSVPKEYLKVIRNVTEDICKNVDNYIIEGLLSKERYYSAASYCFRERSEKYKVNLTDKEINELIEKLKSTIEKYKCKTFECKEIKYQILQRLNMAKNLTGTQKYWRYYTAEGWYKFLDLANKIKRADTCKIIKEEYKIIKYLYQDLPETNNCFEIREYLAKIYTTLITYRDENALNSILNLVKFYLKKNGFSISAYNYMQYAEDLYKLNEKDSAFYYAVLALEYAI